MTLATNMDEISKHINEMKFKKKLFGGVDEKDVWEKIKQLDADYQNIFKLQQQLYRMEIKKAKQRIKNDKSG